MPLPCETRSTDLVGLISQSGKHSISSFEWKRKMTRHLPHGLSGRKATSLPRACCVVAPGGSVPEVAQGKVQSGEAVGPALSDDEASSLTYPCEEAGRGTTEPLSRALRPHASIVVVAGSQSAFGLGTRRSLPSHAPTVPTRPKMLATFNLRVPLAAERSGGHFA